MCVWPRGTVRDVCVTIVCAYVCVCVCGVCLTLLSPTHQVMRELDRERTALERQEKKLVADIRKMAKSGQMEAVKIMAKDLVRTRAFVKRFILMRANIQGIALKVQTLRSQAAMANAMKGVCVCVRQRGREGGREREKECV